MDEIIVRVTRTIACLSRLRILSCLVRRGEEAPTKLADELGMPLALLCVHLSRLTLAGLIQRRRSGVWCYCVARSPYGEDAFSGRMTSWLCDVLRAPARAMKNCGVAQPRDSRGKGAEAQLHGIIFDAATAFTNVRRLQILRCLARRDAADVQTLTRELSMSPPALARHTAKLAHRGYVQACRSGRLMTYRLARSFKTPIHTRLLEMVRRAWERKEFHTSELPT